MIKDNKVLLVKERFAISGKWKLPGGHADSGEDLGEAAVREVFEETGIRAKELGLITFRHTHPHPQLNFPCKIFELSNKIFGITQYFPNRRWAFLSQKFPKSSSPPTCAFLVVF